jgi:thioredoxin reductase (NADPH)
MMFQQVVILGAGPAGISTAVEAIKKGFRPEEILILEKFDEVAYMISSKYPEEKAVLANYKNKSADPMSGLRINDMTKQEFMSFMKDIVSEYKLNIKYNQTVGKISKLKNGQISIETANDVYLTNSLFIAIGTMSTPRTLSASVAESVSDKIFYDIQKIDISMKKILVVGGGDSAAEFAKILLERGHSVSLSYRGETFEKMLPTNKEITLKLINDKKITFYPATTIEKIEARDDRPCVYFKELPGGTEFDGLVTALGNEKPSNYLSTIGILMGHEGDEIFSASSLEGVFFVGDLASIKGGGTINIAFNSGVKAMVSACANYLDCKVEVNKK